MKLRDIKNIIPSRAEIAKRLRKKYKIEVRSDSSFEHKITFRVTLGRIFLWSGITMVVLLVGFIYLATNSSILETDASFRRKFIRIQNKADSLEKAIQAQEIYIQNIQNVIQGKLDIARLRDKPNTIPTESQVEAPKRPDADKDLRQMVEQQGFLGDTKQRNALLRLGFVYPVVGKLIQSYDLKTKHFGIDIATSKDATVYSILPGKVSFVEYSPKQGYSITIKHINGILSQYKFCSALSKKVGNFVKRGQPIAKAGMLPTEEVIYGIHFEIWAGNTPVNPSNLFEFKFK